MIMRQVSAARVGDPGMSFEHIQIQPASGAIGAHVRGVDLRDTLADAVIAELKRALLNHLVLFFREQFLDVEQELAFARRFGEFTRYPFVRGLDGYPDVVEVVKREDERVNFGGLWHSDTTYLGEPPMGSILYARELPPLGGDTLFANMYLAHDSLSQGMREWLHGLVAVNSAANPAAAVTRTARAGERPTEADQSATTAEHPLVRTHPETGAKALYVNPGHTVRIAGFTEQESAPVLQVLYEHQSRPEHSCRFRWEPGSVAFWDNRAAQHYALNDYHGHRRVMHRITLAGDRPA